MMRVLIIRHAIAQDREAFAREHKGRPDAERALTKRGRRKMKKGAKGLRAVVPAIDLLAMSPLVRAVQTAEIVGGAYEDLKTVRIGQLSPTKPLPALMQWLASQDDRATVALVGHEPQLGKFVSWALTGLQESFVALKKGAACLIEFEADVKPGRGKLVWLMSPKSLRLLGKRT